MDGSFSWSDCLLLCVRVTLSLWLNLSMLFKIKGYWRSARKKTLMIFLVTFMPIYIVRLTIESEDCDFSHIICFLQSFLGGNGVVAIMLLSLNIKKKLE